MAEEPDEVGQRGPAGGAAERPDRHAHHVRQQGEYDLLGARGTQDADRVEERARVAGGGQKPCVGLADGDVGGPPDATGDRAESGSREGRRRPATFGAPAAAGARRPCHQ
ncbi:hypothetical protein [Streptomyces sp. SM11]|uniref:hypothetical protein n=1 Tax=Streptomyces sp. SM11 TaxID=565557 RepID=UPI0011AFE4FD|nr:hypothetical protein [Streptomyces sp. SM11]